MKLIIPVLDRKCNILLIREKSPAFQFISGWVDVDDHSIEHAVKRIVAVHTALKTDVDEVMLAGSFRSQGLKIVCLVPVPDVEQIIPMNMIEETRWVDRREIEHLLQPGDMQTARLKMESFLERIT